jgi:hypothetical protein
MSSKCHFGRDHSAKRGRLYLIAGVAAVVCAGLAPGIGRAGVIGTGTAGGYTFTNFDPTLSGPGVGSNANGISNTGQAAITAVDVNNMSTSANFSGTATSQTPLNTGQGQVAFGINSNGDVVGGNNNSAFFLPQGGTLQTLTTPPGAINAFGINDHGNIVGQYSSGTNTPGFYLPSSTSNTFVSINAPGGASANIVNAQGINNNGQVVGFYTGNDGQAHGFTATIPTVGSSVTGTAVADPTIPPVSGEPGAVFVFSQILGVNDSGIAVGYYGDSTVSQHGFLYNTNDGIYTFLDDPAAAFVNGVEVTQITGITDNNEIAGFYTDANGIAHSFTACPTGTVCSTTAVPEPASLPVLGIGLLALGFLYRRQRAA